MLSELLARPFSRVAIARDLADAVGREAAPRDRCRRLGQNGGRTSRTASSTAIRRPSSDSACAIASVKLSPPDPPARIAEGPMLNIATWGKLMPARDDAGVDDLATDEGLDVAAELGAVLGGRGVVIRRIGVGDDALVDGRVHGRRGRSARRGRGRRPARDAA